MSKVRTFSRFFPNGHPKQGEPTFFVEKIYHSLAMQISYKLICDLNPDKSPDILFTFWQKLLQEYHPKKLHTIRAGKHFKVGDYFSPRVWSDKPYSSKQIIIAPDLQIKKVWDIEIEVGEKYWFFKLNGEDISNGREDFNIDDFTETLAKNDGLELCDFLNWFPKSFTGQIICWHESVEY